MRASDRIWQERWLYGGALLVTFLIVQLVYIIYFGLIGHFVTWFLLFILSAGIVYTFFLIVVWFGGAKPPAHEKEKGIIQWEEVEQGAHDLNTRNEAPLTPLEDTLEAAAHSAGVLISHDALKAITRVQGDVHTHLSVLIEKARHIYPRTDGWFVLNKERVEVLEKKESEEKQPHGDTIPKNLSAGIPFPTQFVDESVTFVKLLVHGDIESLLAFLQQQKQNKQELHKFFANTLVELDNVHRFRRKGVPDVSPRLLSTLAHISDTQLEKLLGVLIEGLNDHYTSSELNIKLTLVRACSYLEKKAY